MKKIEIAAYGAPEEVARCVDVDDVGTPGAGEIVFDVVAFPINPADLSFCRGSYRLTPALPATPGASVGSLRSAVTSPTSNPATWSFTSSENWAQRRRIAAADAIPLPTGLDLKQAAERAGAKISH
jgi:trans-2-enoyl-CoA reductase